MKSTHIAVLAAPVLFATMIGGVASAKTIYQGSDYSYSNSTNLKAGVCDREADARTAYVQYEAGDLNQGRINDMDGSSGSCWENSSNVGSGIRYHKTCEDINNAVDACSLWDQHF